MKPELQGMPGKTWTRSQHAQMQNIHSFVRFTKNVQEKSPIPLALGQKETKLLPVILFEVLVDIWNWTLTRASTQLL